eukprot:1754604-Rhodomonas_salina.2
MGAGVGQLRLGIRHRVERTHVGQQLGQLHASWRKHEQETGPSCVEVIGFRIGQGTCDDVGEVCYEVIVCAEQTQCGSSGCTTDGGEKT